MSYAPKPRMVPEERAFPPPLPRPISVKVNAGRAEETFHALLREASAGGRDPVAAPVTRVQITQWFEREFGAVKKLTSLEARAARSILERHVPLLAISVRGFVFQLIDALEAQAREQESIPRPLATEVGVARTRPRDPVGTVWATIGGAEVTLGDDAVNAWLLGGGRFVAWSGLDGVGGFENEGQSLRLHDIHTGRSRKMMAEQFEIVAVTSHLLSNGKWALLVEMRDGRVEGEHFAAVNPERGETFRAKLARRTALKEDLLTLGFFRTVELSRPVGQRMPFRSQSFDMKRLLEAPLVEVPLSAE